MTATILPFRGVTDLDVVEGKLIGAVLELEERLEIIEASGLTRDDFRSSRMAVAWYVLGIMVRQRAKVSAALLVSFAKRGNFLGDADEAWLNELEQANRETKDSALQLATDIRVQSRSRSVRSQLQEQVDLIDRGRFMPSHAFGALTGIAHSLATEFTGNETADVDLQELNTQWDTNVKTDQSMLRPTGIRVLDEILGGGVPRNLWIVQGKPGAGKNALLATMIRAKLMADRDAAKPCRIGLFGLESGTAWLVKRWQAEDLGVPLREVGSRKLTPEQWEHKAQHIDPLHDNLLKRVEVYRHNGARTTELGRRAMNWIFTCGVTDILIDNFRELTPDPRVRADYHQQVDAMINTFRNIGFKYGVSIGLLIHDVEETLNQKPGEQRAPHPDKMQGGKGPGAKSRCTIGIYRVDNSYRATVTKNEMGEANWPDGPTCEFKFNYTSATMVPDAGRVVDLKSERAQREREATDRKREKSADERILMSQLMAKKKAATDAPAPDAKPVEPPAQASLLDVPTSTKPEGST